MNRESDEVADLCFGDLPHGRRPHVTLAAVDFDFDFVPPSKYPQ